MPSPFPGKTNHLFRASAKTLTRGLRSFEELRHSSAIIEAIHKRQNGAGSIAGSISKTSQTILAVWKLRTVVRNKSCVLTYTAWGEILQYTMAHVP